MSFPESSGNQESTYLVLSTAFTHLWPWKTFILYVEERSLHQVEMPDCHICSPALLFQGDLVTWPSPRCTRSFSRATDILVLLISSWISAEIRQPSSQIYSTAARRVFWTRCLLVVLPSGIVKTSARFQITLQHWWIQLSPLASDLSGIQNPSGSEDLRVLPLSVLQPRCSDMSTSLL